MFDSMPFGHWLKEYRNAHGLTRAELARRVGCSVEMIHKIELGQRRPSRQIAELLADAVHIEPEQRELFIDFARAGTRGEGLGARDRAGGQTASGARGPNPSPLVPNLRIPLNRL